METCSQYHLVRFAGGLLIICCGRVERNSHQWPMTSEVFASQSVPALDDTFAAACL